MDSCSCPLNDIQPSREDRLAQFGDDERYLIVVNLSECPVQARVQVLWAGGGTWQLVDLLSDTDYERSGDEMLAPGLYVGLAPWKYHFFQCLHEKRT